MDEGRLAAALQTLLGKQLAQEIASDFVKTRLDFATKTLERPSAGKFVETFVQSLQYLVCGKYDAKPDVDAYITKKAETEIVLPEGLRISGARVARAIYTLRNKRNIAHKGEVDPNTFDLAFVHQGTSWIVAELLRNAQGIKMEEAGALIELIQAPVGSLVEDIDGVRLVHAEVSLQEELLILLHSHYPHRVSLDNMCRSMAARGKKSITNRLREMCDGKLIIGDGKLGYRLTATGHAAAAKVICAVAKV